MDATARVIATEYQAGDGAAPDIGRAVEAMGAATISRPDSPECPDRVVELLDDVSLPEQAELQALVRALREAAPRLRWTDPYSHREDQRALRAGYFVTTLVGSASRTAALAVDDTASVFLTVQAPHLLYPRHAHLAPELYCAVAGTADWQKGDAPFGPQPPGSWMVHPPWMSHAMQTRDEPLVALAIWTADLDSVATLDAD